MYYKNKPKEFVYMDGFVLAIISKVIAGLILIAITSGITCVKKLVIEKKAKKNTDKPSR